MNVKRSRPDSNRGQQKFTFKICGDNPYTTKPAVKTNSGMRRHTVTSNNRNEKFHKNIYFEPIFVPRLFQEASRGSLLMAA